VKIRLVGDELLRADGQTDRYAGMTKLLVTFRSFDIAPKNLLYHSLQLFVLDVIYVLKNAVNYTARRQ